MKNSGLLGKRTQDFSNILSIHDIFYQTKNPASTSLRINDSNIITVDDETVSAVDATAGDTFVIIGTGLLDTGAIIINGILVTDFTIVSDTEIVINSLPLLSSGLYDLFIKNAAGTAASVTTIYYNNEKLVWDVQDTSIYITPGVDITRSLQLNYNIDQNETYQVLPSTPLPAGLTLSSAGILTGNVSMGDVGSYTVTVIAVNEYNQKTSKTFTFVVRDKRWDVTSLNVSKEYSTFNSLEQLTSFPAAALDFLTLAMQGAPTYTGNNPQFYGFTFSPDGKHLYTVSDILHYLIQYYCATPWDLTTAKAIYYVRLTDIRTTLQYAADLFISPDGTMLFTVGRQSTNTGAIFKFSLSVPWMINTIAFQSVSTTINSNETTPTDLFFKPDGTRLWIYGSTSRTIREYNLSTAWDISTLVLSKSLQYLSTDANASISFSADGTTLWYAQNGLHDTILRSLPLTSAWTLNASFSGASSPITYTVPSDGVNNTYISNIFLGGPLGFFAISPRYIYTLTPATLYNPRTWVDFKDVFVHRGNTFRITTTSISSHNAVISAGGAAASACVDFYGNNLYVLDSVNRYLIQYLLTTPGDLSSAVSKGLITIPVSIGALGKINISRDGSRFFILESGTKKIHYFTMPSRYSIANMEYDSYDSFPREFSDTLNSFIIKSYVFSTNGEKIYISTDTNVRVYQLSAPWDLSGNNILVDGRQSISGVTGIGLDEQSTKLTIIGSTVEQTFESFNSLSLTAWQKVSNSMDAAPQTVVFSSDGLMMYITGSQVSVSLQQYKLAVAWDTTTATLIYHYLLATLFPTAVGTTFSLRFNETGTILYSLTTDDIVQQYSLTTAWDISTITFVGQSLATTAQETTPTDLFFKPDGTRMYIVGSSSDRVNEYNLSTAWDITTVTYSRFFSVATEETVPAGISFKPDGTRMYIVGSTGDDVNEYSLSTAWDISTATFVQLFSIAAEETTPTGMFFKPDGTRMYIIGSSGDDVNEYNLSTPWDISSAVFSGIEFKPFAPETTPSAMAFKSDGSMLYVLGSIRDRVTEYVLSEPWMIRSARYLRMSITNVNTQDSFSSGIFISPDGVDLFMVGTTNDSVHRYTTAIPWNFSVMTLVATFSVAAEETLPTGIFFKPDGTRMYIVGSSGDDVNEYSLSTAWDITTAAYVRLFSVAAQETNPSDLFFKPDGTRMYIVGTTGDDVNEYNLSTPWDISTASFVAVSPNFTQYDTTPTSLAMDPTGQYAYVLGTVSNTVYQLDFK
jgi:sugar lactone lactonase YvrE